MSLIDLSGKRILVTEAGSFMGPALCGVLGECGAEVFADQRASYDRESILAMAAEAGTIDALVINLGIPAPTTRAVEVSEDEWRSSFARMVDPLPRLCAAFLPEMTERGSGKIVLMGSASALRGMRRTTTYSAARGAQLAYVQALGVEMAPHNVQVNAIAQNFVDNPTYFPSAVQANPAFQARLSREVPLGRLVSAREDALFAAYLCSAAANCFVGQVFPLCGGWVLR
jgi:NAD(P)-dependent dehydrogenase (short-subunit alcohol dehydrogenase family)